MHDLVSTSGVRLHDPARRLGAAALLAAIVAGATLGVLVLTDDEEEGSLPVDVTVGETRAAGDRGEPHRRSGAGGAGSEPSPASLEERRVERTVTRYVAALNDREGDRVCDLFVPGALDDVKLPVEDGDCGEAVTASIGYRDPRGFPQWEEAFLPRFDSTDVEGDEAKVTATIVSEFADRDEPSVEDDVIYLERRGGHWQMAQPSAVLYRAIGAPDLPLELLTPPG